MSFVGTEVNLPSNKKHGLHPTMKAIGTIILGYVCTVMALVLDLQILG